MKTLAGALFLCLWLAISPGVHAGNGISPAVSGKEILTNPDYQEKLLKFQMNGHILGFTSKRMYIVGLGYSLSETFVRSNEVAPQQETKKDPGGIVKYSNLWDNISLIYRTGETGIAESFFHIAPQGDSSDIRLQYNAEVEIGEDGSLHFHPLSDLGHFTTSPPKAWQDENGKHQEIAVSYVRNEDQTIGFRLGSYDRNRPVVIDPIYQWHSFYGSSSADDSPYDMATDQEGNIYITGFSKASWIYTGSIISILPRHGYSGDADIVVIKLNSSGNYLWHTFYGSSAFDVGQSIAVDNGGGIYVTGRSIATWNGPIFYQSPRHGHSGGGSNSDIFVLKLNSNGGYQWHTFYGSADYDEGNGIAVDQSGNAYIAAIGNGTWNGPGPTDPISDFRGDYDIAVLKLDANGAYQWHTFYGSIYPDRAYGVAVDSNGSVYVTGHSDYIWIELPGFTLPLHTFSGGTGDIFILKLKDNGEYQWHTFYGSDSGFDVAEDITADEFGNVYVAGYSDKTWNGPNGENPKNTHSDNRDLMVLNLDGSGSYRYHTFYGTATPSASANGHAITTDSAGNVYIAGRSNAEWNGPAGQSPQNAYTGDLDILILALDSSGDYRNHSFYGSPVWDGAVGIAVNSKGQGDVSLVGYSDAGWDGPEGVLPLRGYHGGRDIVVMGLNPNRFPWMLFLPAMQKDSH